MSESSESQGVAASRGTKREREDPSAEPRKRPRTTCCNVLVRLRPWSAGEEVVDLASVGQGRLLDRGPFLIQQPEVTQEQVYASVEEAVQRCSDTPGANATIFAYGQSGSGKTHTMFGDGDGVAYRAVRTVLEKHEEVSISAVEVYNNKAFDLFVNREGTVRLGTAGLYQVAGQTEKRVCSVEEFQSALQPALEARKVGEAVYNERSSRSHMFIMIYFKVGETRNRLTLIDLAGSERTSDESSARKAEGNHINQDLMALGKVVRETDSGSQFVSFRNRTLTLLLKNTLGGRNVMKLVVCVNPLKRYEVYTKQSLDFAQIVQNITVKIPVAPPPTTSRADLEEENRRLKEEVATLRRELEEEREGSHRAVPGGGSAEDELAQVRQHSVDLQRELERSRGEIHAIVDRLRRSEGKSEEQEQRIQQLSRDLRVAADLEERRMAELRTASEEVARLRKELDERDHELQALREQAPRQGLQQAHEEEGNVAGGPPADGDGGGVPDAAGAPVQPQQRRRRRRNADQILIDEYNAQQERLPPYNMRPRRPVNYRV